MNIVAQLKEWLMAILWTLCLILGSIFFISVVFVYTRNLDEKARGKMAGAFLKKAIDNGTKVVIQTKLKDSRGKFGRVLGDVVVDGININKSMIDHFHAAAYFGQSKEAIEAVHDANRTRLIELGLFTPVK